MVVTLFKGPPKHKNNNPKKRKKKKKRCEQISLNLKLHALATKMSQYNKFLSYVEYGKYRPSFIVEHIFKVNS